MKKHRYSKLIYISLVIMLLSGCASTGAKKDGAKEEIIPEEGMKQAEKIDNVTISEFILGAGDSIDITVYRNDDLKRSVKIDSSGKIMYPLIGDIQAAGLGVFELRDEIQKRLSRYIVNPQVTINITGIQSQKIIVLGEVKNPGIFTIEANMSIMEAVTKAGGMTGNAKLNNVLLIRRQDGKAEVTALDLKKVLKGDDLSQDKILRSGDIVYLPSVMIADVSWFMGHLGQILSPIVSLESGMVLWPQVKNVLRGKDGTTTTISIPAN
ncbi:MAG: polysaccharide biosynthesis/export family protein [Ignavibacteriae bacterium]|nr:polysaccharide biosynthesis/export family protein [Ignavibacteriota bacterium]